MKEIGKILAGICAVLFVISSATALLLFNIEQKAFSPKTFKQAFKEEGLYAQTPSLIASVLAESPNLSGTTSALLSLLNKDELALVISSLLPPEEIEMVTNDTLDSSFAFLDGKTDTVALSLIPFKTNMAGEGGVRAFTQILQAQPDCTLEQLFQIGAGLLSSNPTLMMCNPPPDILQMAMPLIQSQIQVMAANIPDEITLVTTENEEASLFRTRLDRIRTVLKWTPILPLFLLIVLTLFAVRSLNDWLKWWGIPFLVTGMSGIFVAIVGAPLIRFFVETVLLQGGVNLPVVFQEMLGNIFGSLTRQILSPVLIESVLLTLIGAGMILGFILKTRVFDPSNTSMP